MRIDSHHSCSEQHPLDYLWTILNRNRFEKSILVGPPQDVPDFVAGIVVPILTYEPAPRICGVQVLRREHIFDAVSTGLPVDLLGLLPEVSAMAGQHPGTTFIIDHLGDPADEEWADHMEAAAEFPNVYCKLSGLTRVPEPRPYVQRALALFGPARLMFGSDWPNGLPAYTWKASLAVFTQSIGAQPIEVREQLLGGTAARVYGI